jgi:hypothetical protein
MRQIFLLAIIGIISCDNADPDPLIAKLTNTTWEFSKAELYENGVFVTELTPATNFQDQKLSFNSNNRIELSGAGNSCGEWGIKNGRLSFMILHGQIVEGLCRETNFSDIFLCDSKAIELINSETLILEDLCGTFQYFYYLPDWYETRTKIFNEEYKLKTYYNKVIRSQSNEQTCCGEL